LSVCIRIDPSGTEKARYATRCEDDSVQNFRANLGGNTRPTRTVVLERSCMHSVRDQRLYLMCLPVAVRSNNLVNDTMSGVSARERQVFTNFPMARKLETFSHGSHETQSTGIALNESQCGRPFINIFRGALGLHRFEINKALLTRFGLECFLLLPGTESPLRLTFFTRTVISLHLTQTVETSTCNDSQGLCLHIAIYTASSSDINLLFRNNVSVNLSVDNHEVGFDIGSYLRTFMNIYIVRSFNITFESPFNVNTFTSSIDSLERTVCSNECRRRRRIVIRSVFLFH